MTKLAERGRVWGYSYSNNLKGDHQDPGILWDIGAGITASLLGSPGEETFL